jgi:hypothetical protein
MTNRNARNLAQAKNALPVDIGKLKKLTRLLGSNHDGEALGAVAAIARTLLASGLDWHDLADAIQIGFSKPPAPPKRSTKRSPPPPDPDWWESMVNFCDHHRVHLSDSDYRYIGEVRRGLHFVDGSADETMMRRLRGIVAKIEAALDGWAS